MEENIRINGIHSTILITKSRPPEVGYFIKIELSTTLLTGSVEGEVIHTDDFIEALSTMYKNTKGEARLKFLGSEHVIKLTCNETGMLCINVEITEGTPHYSSMSVEEYLDQSYLPNIIDSFKKVFS
jgi:predicted transcriptional regulator YheO